MEHDVLAPATPESLSDETIVDRVLAGETALYEVLMQRHNRRLYRVIRSILKGDRDVEDVMQEAYVRAFQHLARFERRSKLSTWLTRIAVNEALARMHQSRGIEEWDALSEQRRDAIVGGRATRHPESEAGATELRERLEVSIERLPARYRAVVMLRDVEGLSTAETAACLAISEDNVRTRLHRAHVILRKELPKDAFPFPATRCDRVVSRVLARVAGLH